MSDTSTPETSAPKPLDYAPPPATEDRSPVVRTLLTGGLMGLANLVPGVSGGTMVLVMGLYEKFIASVAAVSRGKPTRSALFFLGLIIAGAAVAVVGLAGVASYLVRTERSLMYALFIGMTLAGTPVLWKMARPLKPAGIACFLVGLAIMVGLAFTDGESAKEAASAMKDADDFRPVASVVTDLLAGALAMSAMVLPGISGGYMLLILGRYEHVTGAISLLKDGLTGGGTADIVDALWIIVPVGIGAVLSLVLLSNLLRWLLKHHEKTMGGLLLGVLWGSAFAIFPFDATSTGSDYVKGAVAFIVGFAAVYTLTLFAPKETKEPSTSNPEAAP